MESSTVRTLNLILIFARIPRSKLRGMRSRLRCNHVSSVGRICKLLHKGRFSWLQGLAAAAVLVGVGCAGTGKEAPLSEQQLLVFSGFSLKLGYTQAAIEEVGKLPQRRIVRIESEGQQLYVWADAAGCRCWYVGDQSAYQRLLELGWENKPE